MRRQSAPSDRAAQAELIEMRGIIVGDSAGEDEALPCIGGYFKTLQLAKDFERAMLAAHLRAGSDMLPAQKPVHELRRRDRLDLLAQRSDRKAMDASQQAALAPLGFSELASAIPVTEWPRRSVARPELSAEDDAAGLDS